MRAGRTRPQGQRGETLAGLLVGMALGLLVLTAGTQMLAQLMRGHRLALQDSHLQQDLHFAAERMVQELHNAHYVAGAWSSRSPDQCDDPFCGQSADFQITSDGFEWRTDRNHNGLQDNNECMGFRVADGVLFTRTGCQAGGWQALTDTGSVVVTGLQLQVRCSLANGWVRRVLWLRLEGHWPAQSTRRLQLQRTLSLRNRLPASALTPTCP